MHVHDVLRKITRVLSRKPRFPAIEVAVQEHSLDVLFSFDAPLTLWVTPKSDKGFWKQSPSCNLGISRTVSHQEEELLLAREEALPLAQAECKEWSPE